MVAAGRFRTADVDDGTRYWYVQADSQVPFVQVIVQRRINGGARGDFQFFQMAQDPGAMNPELVPFGRTGVPTSLRPLMNEASRPPILFSHDGTSSPPRMEVCLYCGEPGMLRDYLNAFAVPGYSAKGKACRNCTRVLIVA